MCVCINFQSIYIGNTCNYVYQWSQAGALLTSSICFQTLMQDADEMELEGETEALMAAKV